MSYMPPFIVKLWDTTGTGRGRGTLKAVISDAKDIGASEFANQPGESFFTLPWNHPMISECQPLLRHIEIDRLSSSGDYIAIWSGYLNDYDATEDEVVFYGEDYLSTLTASITGSNSSYTSKTIGFMIGDQIIQGPNARLAFMNIGSIDATTTTTSVLTSFQPRLEFFAQLAEISAAGTSNRPIIQIGPRSSATPSFTFNQNQGSNKDAILLEYGGLVNGFRYLPGWARVRSDIYAIGQKREGATLLFSHQTAIAASTYGDLQQATVFIDIVDQAALDKRTLRAARKAARIGKDLSLSTRVGGLAPWDGYDLGDSIRVKIDRGIVSVNDYFTVWGQEWIGKNDGSEELFLSITPKDI